VCISLRDSERISHESSILLLKNDHATGASAVNLVLVHVGHVYQGCWWF
jgi:hypothetical protein